MHFGEKTQDCGGKCKLTLYKKLPSTSTANAKTNECNAAVAMLLKINCRALAVGTATTLLLTARITHTCHAAVLAAWLSPTRSLQPHFVSTPLLPSIQALMNQ